VEITTRKSVGGWKKLWNRYSPIDFGIGYALLALTLWIWNYVINYFLAT